MSKTWQEAAESKHVIFSATQWETASLCVRKWWFSKVRRLIEPQRGQLTLGTVLHQVADRFFSADDQGCVDGNPVELYPEDWTIAWGKYPDKQGKRAIEGVVSQQEAEWVRSVVAGAISAGVWERLPSRQAEKQIQQAIHKAGEVSISLAGAIDVWYPWRIEDHKTTRGRRYAKTPESLRRALPMLVYAAVAGDRSEPRIELRHNNFDKENEGERAVWEASCEVTWAELDDHWEKVLDLSEGMVKVRASERDWQAVPGPAAGSNACRAYGGCPYLRICSGTQTPEEYERAQTGSALLVPPASSLFNSLPSQKGQPMSSLAEILAKRKGIAPKPAAQPAAEAAAAPTVAALAPPPAPAAVDPVATTVPAAGQDEKPLNPPPWAQADCKACAGEGFNSKGAPCRICDVRAPAELRSGNFDIARSEDGSMTWTRKGEKPAQAPAVAKPVEPPAVAKPVQATDVADHLPLDQEALKEEAEASAPTGKRGRPAAKPFLYLWCVPVGIKCATDAEVFACALQEIVKRNGAIPSNEDWFYETDAFKRRDMLAAVAELALGQVGNKHIVWTTDTPDFKALLAGIKPHCQVIEGVGR